MVDINRDNKPKKAADDLINMLKNEKGVTFTSINEDTAIDYLRDKNNYLRTASYRKNYDKYTSGDNIGKYFNLDFAYLTELSTIDMHFRNILLQMCIDFEHSLKISLFSSVEVNPLENGYNIVDLFLYKHPEVLINIETKVDSIFTGDLIDKYFSVCTVFDDYEDPVTKCHNARSGILKIDCPIWVFVEIISFGDLTKLISFYNTVYPNNAIKSLNNNIMNPIRSLRNACAHNNCLLNNFKPSNKTHPPQEISSYIANISSIGKEERQKKLSCRPLFEIICLLRAYTAFVSINVKTHRINELKIFVNGRMNKHIEYFDTNILVKTSFEFLQKILDNFV